MPQIPIIPPMPAVGDVVSVVDVDGSAYLGQLTAQTSSHGFSVSATLPDGTSLGWQTIPYIGPAMLAPAQGAYLTAQGVTRPRLLAN